MACVSWESRGQPGGHAGRARVGASRKGVEAGANTGLGGGKGQREGRLEGDVPTSAQGAGAQGAGCPGQGLGELRRRPSSGKGWRGG